MILFLILSIFGVVNFLYFTNLIPPLPLSLKDAGVYYSIQKNQDGNYAVIYEKTSWKKYFEPYPNFKKTPNSPVYAYSAIFSPQDLNLTIVHEWQHYDESQNKWVTESVINLPVIGGRDGGFRTYSMRSDLADGKWRVNIKTEFGQTIGRLQFNAISTSTEPVFSSEIKQ